MARGKQLDNEIIYKIMASYAISDSYAATADELGVPKSTVAAIVKKNKDKPEFVELCTQKKTEFADKASVIIDKALDRLCKEIESDENKISARDLAIITGTLYDKRALAKGEATQINGGVIRVELTDD